MSTSVSLNLLEPGAGGGGGLAFSHALEIRHPKHLACLHLITPTGFLFFVGSGTAFACYLLLYYLRLLHVGLLSAIVCPKCKHLTSLFSSLISISPNIPSQAVLAGTCAEAWLLESMFSGLLPGEPNEGGYVFMDRNPAIFGSMMGWRTDTRWHWAVPDGRPSCVRQGFTPCPLLPSACALPSPAIWVQRGAACAWTPDGSSGPFPHLAGP